VVAVVQVGQEQAVGVRAAQAVQALMFLLQELQSPTQAGAEELVTERPAVPAALAGAEQQVIQVPVVLGVLAVQALQTLEVVEVGAQVMLATGLREQALLVQAVPALSYYAYLVSTQPHSQLVSLPMLLHQPHKLDIRLTQ